METKWGSLFYKYIGKMTRNEAQEKCSAEGESVHLPIPRFANESDFYQTYFGSRDFWLGVSVSNGTFESDHYDYEFAKSLPQFTGFKIIPKHGWINLESLNIQTKLNGVSMSKSGEWKIVDENQTLDSFCVYNIIPESCSECFNPNFCRYKKESSHETECVCPDMREGEHCETDLCSKCLNGGHCSENEENEIQCICPYPYEGENCEISKMIKYCDL